MPESLNILDIIFLTFTIIFVLTAFFRGLVKEIFSLLNWIIALTLTYLLTPYATDFLSEHFKNRLLIDSIARGIIFILAFILSAIATSGLRDSLKDKIPKAFDRSLGILFGFVKTLLIFGFIYSVYFNIYEFVTDKESANNEPSWLTESKSYSLIKLSGDMLDPFVKNFLADITVNFSPTEKNLDEKINEIIKEKDHSPEAAIAKMDTVTKAEDKKAKVKIEDSGYSKKDIEKMNHLIEIIDK